MITPNQHETYEQWAERSRQHELELAKNMIRQNKDPGEVLNQMSNRLLDKLLYPLYHFAKEEQESTYNKDVSLAEYKSYFELKNIKPKPDHILDD